MPSTAGAQERDFDNPMYAGPSGNILMCEIAAVAIGTGYAALDCYEEILQRRTMPRSTKIRAEDREFQVYFGEALGLLDLAKSALVGCSQQYMDACRDEVSGKAPFTQEIGQRIVQVEQQCCKLAGDADEHHVPDVRQLGGEAGADDAALLPRHVDAAHPRQPDA